MSLDRFKEVQAAVREVECKPYRFSITVERFQMLDGTPTEMIFIAAQLWRKDTDTGIEGWGTGSAQWIPARADKDYIQKRCFVAARDFAEHEVREAFMVNGKRVLGPHVPLDKLWEVL